MIHNLEQQTLGAEVHYQILIGLQHVNIALNKNIAVRQAGSISSRRWGSGLDFDQLRAYSYGDDPRFIDWKASSRLNTYYTKQFIEDKDANCLLIIDMQDAMYFGSQKRLLSTLGCYSAALLAWKWQKAGYAIALSCISSKQVVEHKPTHQQKQLQKQFHHMAQMHNSTKPEQQKSALARHLTAKTWQKFDHIAVFTHVLAIDDQLLQILTHKYTSRKRVLFLLQDQLLTHPPKSSWFTDGEVTKSGPELLGNQDLKDTIVQRRKKVHKYGLTTVELDTQENITDIAAKIYAL